MALDLAPLVERFYDFFLDLYHKRNTPQLAEAHADAAAPGAPFLAFGPIGAPITPEMFKLGDGGFFTGLVTEQFSGLANLLPELDGTTIASPGLLTADGAYGAMLRQSRPLTADDMAGFGAIKGPAEQAFDQASVPPLIRGGVDYHPALPLPPDWPLPSGDAAWAGYSHTAEQATTVSPPPRPGVPRPTRPWGWRVAPPELQATVKSLRLLQAVGQSPPIIKQEPAAVAVMAAPGRLPVGTRIPQAAMLSASAARIAADPGAVAPAQRVEASRVQRPVESPPILADVVRTEMLQRRMLEVREKSLPQVVTSSSLELSFRYCMVTARRPWLSAAFLTARNWYIPGTRAGEIASGTGQGGGSFEVLPTAALCVRDLVIKAAWSEQERAVLPAMTKFGPFSLIGGRLEAGAAALVCPGIQVIGWVMECMPKLPPNGDPGLAPTGPASA